MKKFLSIFLLVMLLAVGIGSFGFFYWYAQNKPVKIDVVVETDADLEIVQASLNKNQTALDALLFLADKKDFEVKYTDESGSVFIESIMGIENGQEKYWLILLNEEPVEISHTDFNSGDELKFIYSDF